jgi:hypothetical protein
MRQNEVALGDWPMFMMIAEHGNIGFLPEPMAIYRVHEGGTWGGTPLGRRLVQTIRVAEACRKHLGYPGLDDCIYKSSRTLVGIAWSNGNYRVALKAAAKAASTRLRYGSHITGLKKKGKPLRSADHC